MDLRSEISDLDGLEKEELLRALASDWRTAALDEVDEALCAYAEKLTLRPAEMDEADIVRLRGLGLDDVAIHDAIQVVSYFNYINRVADATHVDLEAGMDPYPERIAPGARD